MTEVDRLLDAYIAEHRAGGRAAPLDFLNQVEGTDRAELEALIEGYLERAPGAEWDAQAFTGSAAERLAGRIEPLIETGSLWPVLLPDLRNRAQIKRGDLVARLAQALKPNKGEEKVATYYHQMETGSIPAGGVNEKVLEALGAIVGASAAALRRAGEGLGAARSGQGAGPEMAFARTAIQSPEAPRNDASVETSAAPPEEEWDEVDRLFLGG